MNYIDNIYHTVLFNVSSNSTTKGCAMKLRDNNLNLISKEHISIKKKKEKQNKKTTTQQLYKTHAIIM